MPATKQQARDDVMQKVTAAILADSDTSSIPLEYWDVESDISSADVNQAPYEYIRLIMQMSQGRAATVGGSGSRIQRRNGLFVAQIRTAPGDGQSRADVISEVIESAIFEQSTPNGVRFRNVRTDEIGRDRKWFLTEVKADIEFDQYR